MATGMAVATLPLVALWDTEQGSHYVPIGLTLLPEYYAREAARFAGYRWGEWLVEQTTVRTGVIAHWFANRLFSAHEQDAARLYEEREAQRVKASSSRGH